MGQDLRIINETVVPLHPTVPNPYVILGEIPPSAKWFIVLDLKDAFFAYHWLKNPSIFLPLSGRLQEKKRQQITWTVLPPGFRDSPYLLGRPLARIGSPRSEPGT